jgi:hypothetical protein
MQHLSGYVLFRWSWFCGTTGFIRGERITSNNIIRVWLHVSSTSSLPPKRNTVNDATGMLTDANEQLQFKGYLGNNDGDTVFGGLIAEEVHDA